MIETESTTGTIIPNGVIVILAGECRSTVIEIDFRICFRKMTRF